MELKIKAPAKINLFLSVTGKRDDGFHDLVSVVAPIDFCDELSLKYDPSGKKDSLSCDMEGVPCDESNLVLQATKLFRTKVDFCGSVHFTLKKLIPHGAGLGGGSSDGVAALRLLNQLRDYPLDDATLIDLSSKIGSDCPLFVKEKPLLMRGRGEVLSECPFDLSEYLKSYQILLIKPSFSINTAWAYKCLAEKKKYYISKERTEEKLEAFYDEVKASSFSFTNSFQGVVFDKYLVYGEYYSEMEKLGLPLPCLSGSGSAIFQLIAKDQLDLCQENARKFFGENVFSIATSFI